MATQTALPNIELTDQYLTEAEFARLTGMTIRTIRLWEQKREGPPRIKCGKLIRYRKSAVEQWLRSRESRPCRTPRPRAHRSGVAA